jgi:hypothetical protein
MIRDCVVDGGGQLAHIDGAQDAALVDNVQLGGETMITARRAEDAVITGNRHYRPDADADPSAGTSQPRRRYRRRPWWHVGH